MWSMILLMFVFREDIPSLRTGDRKSSATIHGLLIGTTRRLVPTERSNRRLGKSAVKEPMYPGPGASPWTTLCVKTAILNSILSGNEFMTPKTDIR